MTTAHGPTPSVTLKDVADHVGVNVSTASRALSPERSSLVSAATRARVREAAEHLLSLGHTRVAQLVGPKDIYSFEARARGFRGAIADAGHECIDIDASIVLPTLDAGRDLMQLLLDRTGEAVPTAVFAHNDSIAVGALSEMRRVGLACPDDISIVGYNDVPLIEHLTPPLTTVRLPGYELGRLAAEFLLTLVDGSETTTRMVTLAPELVVRESTRAVG